MIVVQKKKKLNLINHHRSDPPMKAPFRCLCPIWYIILLVLLLLKFPDSNNTWKSYTNTTVNTAKLVFNIIYERSLSTQGKHLHQRNIFKVFRFQQKTFILCWLRLIGFSISTETPSVILLFVLSFFPPQTCSLFLEKILSDCYETFRVCR